jgi:hypothetical protein
VILEADAVTAVFSAQVTPLLQTLVAVGGSALGIGGIVYALGKGWSLFKGLLDDGGGDNFGGFDSAEDRDDFRRLDREDTERNG